MYRAILPLVRPVPGAPAGLPLPGPIEPQRNFLVEMGRALRTSRWAIGGLDRWIGIALLVLLPTSLLRAEIDWSQPIDLERAYQIALSSNPVTSLLEAEMEAADGQLEQAGLKPNPNVVAEVENFLGTGPLSGFDRAEITLGLAQLIERGQKRQRRETFAERSKELLQWELKEAVALLRLDIRQAFYHALIAQQDVALQEELLELARESEVEMIRLSDAARTSAVELSQARLATRRQAFLVETARRDLNEARAALTAYWSVPHPEYYELAGELILESDLPAFETLEGLLEQTPALARFEAEKAVQEASVGLAQAAAHNDITVFAGARYLNENSGDGALVLGVEFPWQLHDRNQGNIRSARAGLRVVASRYEIRRQKLTGDLRVAYQEITNALEERSGLEEDLLPSAEAMLEETRVGYRSGLVRYLDVLGARRTLFEIRIAILDATRRFFQAQNRIEYLTRPSGLPIARIASATETKQ